MEIKKSNMRPAILLGNGLNNYSKLNYSWKELLISLSEKKEQCEKILNSKEISYPEYFDILCFEKGKFEDTYQSLKPDIQNNIKQWKGNNNHKKLIDFAISNNIPIVTTNYDTTLLSDELLLAHKNITKRKKSEEFAPINPIGKKFTDFYPWHSYYSNKKISDAKNEFAIWHMHGFWFYKRSLSIGAIDYGNNINRMKYYLYDRTYGLYKVGYEHWIGKNTWLDIFLHNDIYTIGLGLSVQESSIRWLLLEREKYYRLRKEERRKFYYISNKKYEAISEVRKYYFESIGIFLIEKESAHEIYDFWQLYSI